MRDDFPIRLIHATDDRESCTHRAQGSGTFVRLLRMSCL